MKKLESVRGFDVSAYQVPTMVPYKLLADSGMSFGYVRAVRTKAAQDYRAPAHVAGIRDNKMAVGLYLFFDYREFPEKQLAALVEAHDLADVREGDLVPAIDAESWGPHKACPAWNDVLMPLVAEVARLFGGVLVYHNQADWTTLGEPELPRGARHWVANYSGAPNREFLVWQHASGRVPGVPGLTLDQNIASGPIPRIRIAPRPPKYLETERDITGLSVEALRRGLDARKG